MQGGTLRELGDLRVRELTGHLPSLELGDPFLRGRRAVVSACMQGGPSVAINGDFVSSEIRSLTASASASAIKCNQVQSSAIKCNSVP